MGLRGRGKELGQGRGVKDWARVDWSGGVGPGELLGPRRRNWAAGMGWAGAGLSLVLGPVWVLGFLFLSNSTQV